MGLGTVIAIAAINVVAIFAVIAAHRRRKTPLALAILVVLLVGTGLFGTMFGLYRAFSAIEGADPAQKATKLADGISQAMNSGAYALGAFLLPISVAVVLLVRSRKRDPL